MRIGKRLVVFLFSLAYCVTQHELALAEKQPNVVLILVDDLGWTDLGCYGSTFYDTPHLDDFAHTAVRFTNAYAASPVCSPTRAAIMTGKDPARLHITDWIPGMMPHGHKRAAGRKLLGPKIHNELPLSETTLAEALKEQGYQTFFAGKWHLGGKTHWPQQQGFDINRGGHHVGSPPGGYYSPYKNPQLSDGPDGEYLTDRLTTEAVDFLEARDQSQPFLMCLWYYTVHTPIQGSKKYDNYYQQEASKLPDAGAAKHRQEHQAKTRVNQTDPKYAAMVRSMDENVGRVLETLQQQGIEDDTLVVFTSDNGGLSTTARGGPTSVLPLRAGKGWCYEGGIRVPLMVRAPKASSADTVCESPAIAMDIYPTILQYAGLPLQPEQHQDGVSLMSLIENPIDQIEDAENRSFVWHFPHYHGSLWTPGSAIRDGRWKLVEFYEDEKVELYDLQEDPGEQNDLAKNKPEKAAALRATLHKRLKEMNAGYPEASPN